MRYSLLELVQLMLSSMDSDEVNSISDTVESVQVANICKTTYYDVATDIGLTSTETLFELQPSLDISKPVLMFLPDNALSCDSIRYNSKLSTETLPKYIELEYLPFNMFLGMQQSLDPSDADVSVMSFTVNGESFEIPYRKDSSPTYFTDIGGRTILFNSFDATQDDTLQKSKTMCSGMVYPTFSMTDSFVPDFDMVQYQHYLNKVKARCFAEIKQTQNADALGEARRQKIILQKRDRRINHGPELYSAPRYGRK